MTRIVEPASSRLVISRPFSLYLDAVRIVAALLVVVAHLKALDLLPAGLPVDDLGHESVLVFFVLSGLVIRSTASAQAAEYSFARFTRIYSVVLPAIVFSCATAGLLQAGSNAGSFTFFNGQGALSVLGSSLLFLNEAWFLWNDLPANDPFWSLCYEVWYYAFFGCWFYLTGRRRLLACLIVMCIAGPRIILLMPVWWVGVWLAERQNRLHLIKPMLGWLMLLSGIAGILIIDRIDLASRIKEVTHAIFSPLWVLRHSELFVADYLVAACVLLNFVGFKSLETRLEHALLKAQPAIRWLSASTFSIYLFHYPLLLIAKASIGSVSDWLLPTMIFAAVLTACFAASYVSERQKPRFERWLRSSIEFLNGRASRVRGQELIEIRDTIKKSREHGESIGDSQCG